MIRILSDEILHNRSVYLNDIRSFFLQRNYIEVETPLVNPNGGVDPFLDPLAVVRTGIKKSVESLKKINREYLITSPEYNLKIILANSRKNIFQISHCFREGDSGENHTEEFIMLEWYHQGIDEFELMQECYDLLIYLSNRSYSVKKINTGEAIDLISIKDLFRNCCNSDLTRESLKKSIIRYNLNGQGENIDDLRYDELFFILFLNRIESQLGKKGPQFIYHFPAELAALSEIKGDICRRFELFWERKELANGYYELTLRTEQEKRFHKENQLRTLLGKDEMVPDPQLLSSLDQNFPAVSGIALGLDRLLAILMGKGSLREVTPFL